MSVVLNPTGLRGGARLDIAGDYELQVGEVLPSLGFNDPASLGVPSLSEIEDAISSSPMGNWLTERSSSKLSTSDQLLITPRVSGIGGIGLASLITRQTPDAFRETTVKKIHNKPVITPSRSARSWGTQTDGSDNPRGNFDPSHDHSGADESALWDVCVVLNDEIDPRSGDLVSIPGLVYRELALASQRRQLFREQVALAEQGIAIASVTPGNTVVELATWKAVDKTSLQPVGWNVVFDPAEKFPNIAYLGYPPVINRIPTACIYRDRDGSSSPWRMDLADRSLEEPRLSPSSDPYPNNVVVPGVRRVAKVSVPTADHK